jgi:hypothetical protein
VGGVHPERPRRRSDRCRRLWVFGLSEQLDLLVVIVSFLGSVIGNNRVGLPQFVVLLVSLGLCFWGGFCSRA